MKTALIATLYNEADNLSRWWESICRQTVQPDEMVIVDGCSTDGTWENLQALAAQCRVPVKLEQRRCNIAEGRNRAIALTDAEIIVATDAGSFPDANWFGEITRDLWQDETLDVTGGNSLVLAENEFQKFLLEYEGHPTTKASELYPSSRNIAFRRRVWEDVGGYPEWMTLAGEDFLFNHELHLAGKKIRYNPAAVVRWTSRPDPESYYKLLYRNGYGAAEARMAEGYFLRRLAVALIPPLVFFSKYRFRHLKFRYCKNLYSAAGWIAGLLAGRRPPRHWKRIEGILLSPEAQQCRMKWRA